MALITSNSITFVDNTGIEKYIYIRYSNDGETFTENNGLTPGSWLGTCTTNTVTAPTDFDAYQWSKIGSYFHVKYSNDGATFTDNNGETVGDWMGTCITDAEDDPTNFEAYTWKKIAGRGIVSITEYYLLSSEKEGITRDSVGWTTNIQSLNKDNKYLWNYEKTEFTNDDIDESEPMIIGVYGDGIKSITNYYAVTSTMTAQIPDENWQEGAPPGLSSTNKYLWNYETITYTDDTEDRTTPAIIGIYGDSGADAITFEIYSAHGFMFKRDLESITLQIASFKGSETIDNATYTWEWWDDRLNDGAGAYVKIKDTTEKTLTIKNTATYALAHLKCTMEYDGKFYEDYVSLTNETVIYTSVVKFFDGRNIFHADDLYLVAYIELYQNNHKIETIFADKYCSGISSVSNGTITAKIDSQFSDGDKMYFICKNASGLYEVVLGECVSGVWKVVDTTTQYTYTNTLYSNIQSNVIAISKESINKSANIDFTVLKDNVVISETNVNIIDSNDPMVGDSAPSNPVEGQLWLDTSAIPHILKIYNDGNWSECTEKIGGAVFTSQPSSYSAGDLWILANGEKCGDFGSGSMLKATVTSATFSVSHWIDADEKITELKNNIKQYFTFDPDSGLKLGQVDEKFYVNISSTEMGFYDNSKQQHQKVVSIANDAAVIRNLTVRDSATFASPVTFEQQVNFFGFILKKESNGSLSLAIDN